MYCDVDPEIQMFCPFNNMDMEKFIVGLFLVLQLYLH